jgi:hypothetical protein
MAATLDESVFALSNAELETILGQLHSGSVAFALVHNVLCANIEAAEERYAEDGYVRMLENRGYDEARFQEQMEAARGIF